MSVGTTDGLSNRKRKTSINESEMCQSVWSMGEKIFRRCAAACIYGCARVCDRVPEAAGARPHGW